VASTDNGDAIELRVLAALPTPPPYSGPETVAALLLRSGLGPGARLIHVRTNVQKSNASKGHVTGSSLARLAAAWVRALVAIARDRPHVLYLYLSQNWTGFLRDLIFIWTARCARLAVVVQIHGSNFSNFVLAASPFFRSLIRRSFRSIDDVVVLADRLKPQVAGLVPDDRVWVVPNAVSTGTPWRPRPDRATCTFFFMGHLSVAKGFADLLRAVPLVLEAEPDARFEFAGEWVVDDRNIHSDERQAPVGRHQRLAAECSDLCSRFGSRVRLLGLVSGAAKDEAFERADVFVLPSYSEGLPMAILEAMEACLPLVVTPVGALPEILTSNTHGVFVEPGDVNALVSALLQLARDTGLRGRMGVANARLVRERFTPACVSTALRQCLEASVARHQTQR